MTTKEKHQHLMFFELEKFGKVGIGKKRYSHEYNAFKTSRELFLERGTRFSSQPLPQLARNSIREGRVKIISEYPDWYIEQENRKLEKANQDKKIQITPMWRKTLKRELAERMRIRRRKEQERRQHIYK